VCRGCGGVTFWEPFDSRQTCLYNAGMRNAKASARSARTRLIETADRLFYKAGIHAVGIDRIIAEAGVAKMTLYTHFKSKDELIVEVLQHRDLTVLEFFKSSIERNAKKMKGKAPAFFAALKEWFECSTFRGCAFINASIELADFTHAAAKFVREQKRRFTDLLGTVVEDALGKPDGELTAQIALLVEGAIVTAQIQGKSEAANVAYQAARKLLAEARTG
jgi:AcrR family transcriptional regulator